MKVLHVLNELKPSGAETMLRSAAPYWAEHDVTCEILATGKTEGEFAETLRIAGYRVHHLPRRRTPKYYLDFRRFVDEGRYHLIHQHAEGSSYWFGLATLSAGAGLVRTVHSNFAFDGNLRWRRALQRRHLQALNTHFVSIATGVQKNEFERFGIKTELVWNWIDTERFKPVSNEERVTARDRWGFDAENLVLVSLGNCSVVKNHAVLLEALACIPELSHVRYLHIGQEDTECSERQLVEKLGLGDYVKFCGWMTNPREALAAADLYVMPSIYEGLGLAALEALGIGLPALLADVNGLRDLKEVFPNLMYAAPQPEAFARAIREFAMLGALERSSLSSQYPKLVKDKFSVARGVQEYCSLYKVASRRLVPEKRMQS